MMIDVPHAHRIAKLAALKYDILARWKIMTVKTSLLHEMNATEGCFRSVQNLLSIQVMDECEFPVIYLIGIRNAIHAQLDVLQARVHVWRTHLKAPSIKMLAYIGEADLLIQAMRADAHKVYPNTRLCSVVAQRYVAYIDTHRGSNYAPEFAELIRVIDKYSATWDTATDEQTLGHKKFVLSFLKDYRKWLVDQYSVMSLAQTPLVCAELILIIDRTLNDLQYKE